MSVIQTSALIVGASAWAATVVWLVAAAQASLREWFSDAP